MAQANRVHSTPLTNTPIPQSRRGFLGRAITALAAGVAFNSTAIVVTRPAAAATAEDPSINALGDRIEPLLETFRNAVSRRNVARAAAEANCPSVPDELVCKGLFYAGCTERERDVEDKDVWPVAPDGKAHRPPREILNSERVKAAIERGNLYYDRRTKFGKQLAKKIEIAERYETSRNTAIEQSGLLDAKNQLYFASLELEKIAYTAAEIEPRTLVGVYVQARALNAYAETEIELDHYRGRSGQVVGIALAQSVSRLVGKAVT
jgi:hypothetical protein